MDIIVVGAGHNAIVAAWHLARAGHSVDVYEQLDRLGGACSTRRFDCGCYLNDAANAFGMLHPQIQRDLNDLTPESASFDVTLSNPSLALPASHADEPLAIYVDDPNRTATLVAERTDDNEQSVLDFSELVGAAVEAMRGLWTSPEATIEDARSSLRSLGADWPEVFLNGSLLGLLERFFVDTRTRALFMAGNTILPLSLRDPGTAFPVLYLGTSAVGGIPGWGIVTGGMDRIIASLAHAAIGTGVRFHESTRITEIVVKGTVAIGVRTEQNDFLTADVIVSGIDPYSTFMKLLKGDAPIDHQRERLRTKNFDGGCAKLNLLLSKPLAIDQLRSSLGPEDLCQIVCCPSIEYFDAAYLDYRNGTPSRRPYVEIMMAYPIDGTASCGQHFPVSLYALFTPYEFETGMSPESISRRRVYESILGVAEAVDPAISSNVEWSELLLPVDLERRYGMYRGNVDHGPLAPGNRMEERPFALTSAGQTGLENLFLCGSGIHPGGLVSGMPGMNAARTIIEMAK